MEGLEPTYDLDEHIPDLLFFDVGLSLLVVCDLLKHITVVG